MNNIFYEMIFKRKSFHIFRNVGNESIGEYELNDIQSAYSEGSFLDCRIKMDGENRMFHKLQVVKM